MRMTYTMLKEDILRNIGLPGDATTDITTFVNLHLQTRYQDVMAAFGNWKNQVTQTSLTVENQQYYALPPNVVQIETAQVLQGNINYPIKVVNSQEEWNYINQYPNIQTFIPQYMFPRPFDFGIWPIPQSDDYVITLNYIYRDKNLNAADYTTGTASINANGLVATLAGGAALTDEMIGRWFAITDSSGYPITYWYLITDIDNATKEVTLQNYWQGLTYSGAKYIIGQTPSLPDEAHILLSWGVTADWYLSRGNTNKAQEFSNLYYTGDASNTNRSGVSVLGGLYGLRERYAERADHRVTIFNKKSRTGYYPEWVNKILP